MQAAPVAPMPMAAFEAYASKAAIGVGATGAIGCSAQRSSCGVARVGGEKWGVRFHVFPNSDGSHLKWDTPHINQPINQGFLGPGLGYGVVEAQVRVAANARSAWHPASWRASASTGIFPSAASAATSGAGTDCSACSPSSSDSRLMAPASFTTPMLFNQFPGERVNACACSGHSNGTPPFPGPKQGVLLNGVVW